MNAAAMVQTATHWSRPQGRAVPDTLLSCWEHIQGKLGKVTQHPHLFIDLDAFVKAAGNIMPQLQG